MIYNVTIKILNLTSIKTAKNIKKWEIKELKEDLEAKFNQEVKTEFLFLCLSLFPNHELKAESEIATNV